MARIAFLLPDMRGGGAERVALTLMERFLGHGHEVDLILMSAAGELMTLLPPQIRVFDLKARRIRNALRPLVRYLRQRRPDGVQVSLWPLTIITVIAGCLSRTKARIVTSDHTMLSSQYGGSWRGMAWLRLTTRWLYPLADARICVSAAAADDLARISGLPRDHFTVITNPVALPSGPIVTNSNVERLWSGAARRILTVGSLKPAKNHALLIRALALLIKQADARLMILGDGPLRRDLERQARELGLAERVILPGFDPDPWPYYASADLFVLSSDREGYPVALAEAMAVGVPVVSTDCASGPREILDGGRYGALVPCGDLEALARAMADALGEPHDPRTGRDRICRLSEEALDHYSDILLSVAKAN